MILLPRGTKFMVVEYDRRLKEHWIVDFAKTDFEAQQKMHARRKKRLKAYNDDLPRRKKAYPNIAHTFRFEYTYTIREIGKGK